MRYVLIILGVLTTGSAWGYQDLVPPHAKFSAIAVHDASALGTRETIHYAKGKLRIDRGNGFSGTILDLTAQSLCLLMANHTYLLLRMTDELFRRYIARMADMSGAVKVGKEWSEGLETTKYAFGDDGRRACTG